MNYSMVKVLMLKDWYLQRWLILAAFGGGLASLAVVAFGGNVGFIFGLILLITALITLSAQLAISTIVNERKEQTLPFVMSLPVSYREYTASKILGNLLLFTIPWLLLLAASVGLLLLGPKSHGLVPYTVIMATEILVNACLIVTVATVTESQPWTIAAIITGNVGLNIIGYLVAHVPGISAWMWGAAVRWTPAAYAVLCTEYALIALLIGGTFFVQSRKQDFL